VKQQGVEVKVIRNDECLLSDIIELNPEAIIISPGPGRPENAGMLMELINHFVTRIPVLGICLGHQAIAIHFGSKLVNAKHPLHGKTSEIIHQNHVMFNRIPSGSEMMRYHSLIIEDLAKDLISTSVTINQEIMSIAHVHLPVWGLQFHPESILSPKGPQIIKNWLSHFQLIKDFKTIC
jgi:anthranilate synthase/aminodeoxychorismate synthase-like glutamine amidotransferase